MFRPEAAVTFGAKPMGPPPLRPRPPTRGDTAFAVGSRALITPTGTAGRDVQLLDEDGMPTDRRLPADATVVITAWRPRRSAPPRYRVCTNEQIEGWVDAANLRRLPPPPPPVPIAMPAPPPKATPAKAAPKAPAKGAVAAAKAAVAPKPAVAAPKPPAKPAPAPAAKAAARKPAQPSPAAARARQAPAKPPAKPKRSRPTSKRAR